MALFTIDDILKPFERLDISTLYNHYCLIIDGTIFFLIFLGVCRTTIGKRFEGSGGTAITTGLTLALTAAALIMEKSLNFSLRSFGPLAVVIVMLLVGFVFYSILLTVGFSHINALYLAYLVDYLSIRLVSPDIFDWIATTAPFVNGILGIIFIIALAKLLFSLLPRSSKKSLSVKCPSGIAAKTDTPDTNKKIGEDEAGMDKIESKLLRYTKKEIKNSDELVETVEEMIRLIDQYGTVPQAVKELSSHLKNIQNMEHYTAAYFSYINKVLDRIGRFDNEFYSDLLADYETAQNSDQKKILKKQITVEKKKREIEEALDDIEHYVARHSRQFNRHLTDAIRQVEDRNPSGAVQYLTSALHTEQKIKQLYEDMRTYESELKKLSTRNLKNLKKEKKGSS